MTKKLLATLFCICCLATAAFADAKKDRANAKIHPAQIVRSCTKVIQADPTAAWAFVNRAKSYTSTAANYGKMIADYNFSGPRTNRHCIQPKHEGCTHQCPGLCC
jgi:hypothetical protein